MKFLSADLAFPNISRSHKGSLRLEEAYCMKSSSRTMSVLGAASVPCTFCSVLLLKWAVEQSSTPVKIHLGQEFGNLPLGCFCMRQGI